jgi:hypothetical protein
VVWINASVTWQELGQGLHLPARLYGSATSNSVRTSFGPGVVTSNQAVNTLLPLLFTLRSNIELMLSKANGHLLVES